MGRNVQRGTAVWGVNGWLKNEDASSSGVSSVDHYLSSCFMIRLIMSLCSFMKLTVNFF